MTRLLPSIPSFFLVGQASKYTLSIVVGGGGVVRFVDGDRIRSSITVPMMGDVQREKGGEGTLKGMSSFEIVY